MCRGTFAALPLHLRRNGGLGDSLACLLMRHFHGTFAALSFVRLGTFPELSLNTIEFDKAFKEENWSEQNMTDEMGTHMAPLKFGSPNTITSKIFLQV